jgi:hypothetical protein
VPVRTARLYLAHPGNLFGLYPHTISRTFLNTRGRAAQGIASLVLFLGAVLSLARWRREQPRLWPLALSIASFPLGNSILFTDMRYRTAFEPCLLSMAGLGWANVLRLTGPPREVPT